MELGLACDFWEVVMIQRDAAAPHVLPSLCTNLWVTHTCLLLLVFAIGRLCFFQVSFLGGSLQEMEAMGASLDCRHAEWGGGRCCPSLRDHKWNTLDWVNCLAKHGEPGMTNTITDNPSSSSQICLYPSAPPCTGLAWRVFHGTDYLQTHKKVNLFQTVESIRLHAVLLVY